MVLSLTLAFVVAAQQKDPAERMLELATADQPLVTTAVVNAPVKEVWRAWTNAAEIKKWMVSEAEFELKIGGKMKTAYAAGTDLNGPNSIENAVIAYDPERMLTIKVSRPPAAFPFKEAIAKCWTVIYFQPVGDDKTEVVVRMLGYDHTEDSQTMKGHFKAGNQYTLDKLVEHFSKRGGAR
ncbi:MAG: SRPBCC domain-containing protein [Fimbriimonadaceae bacterium]